GLARRGLRAVTVGELEALARSRDLLEERRRARQARRAGRAAAREARRRGRAPSRRARRAPDAAARGARGRPRGGASKL
ncbi:unnamed protein product, partial [Prorocentrum cordatum]